MKTVSWLAIPLLLLTTARGDTNTPLPAGTSVSVTTSAGTVTGILQDVNVPQWISVLEPRASEPTLIRGTDLIIRRVPAELDAVPRMAPRAAFDRADDVLEDATEGHYMFGRPRAIDDRHSFTPEGEAEPVDGITFLVREVYTVGHYDKMKGPAWVAWRWTKEDFENGVGVSMERPPFEKDSDLPEYAQGGTNFQFSATQMERGHMCPDNDLESFGEDAVAEGMLMSNIVPQRKNKNHKVWGRLEEQTHNVVNSSSHDIETIWIISGPIFAEDEAHIERVGEGNAIPEATYKIIAWKDENDEPHVRAYIIQQNDTNLDLTQYLEPVRTVELQTGLDFFHDLPDEQENELETVDPTTLWD